MHLLQPLGPVFKAKPFIYAVIQLLDSFHIHIDAANRIKEDVDIVADLIEGTLFPAQLFGKLGNAFFTIVEILMNILRISVAKLIQIIFQHVADDIQILANLQMLGIHTLVFRLCILITDFIDCSRKNTSGTLIHGWQDIHQLL